MRQTFLRNSGTTCDCWKKIRLILTVHSIFLSRQNTLQTGCILVAPMMRLENLSEAARLCFNYARISQMG